MKDSRCPGRRGEKGPPRAAYWGTPHSPLAKEEMLRVNVLSQGSSQRPEQPMAGKEGKEAGGRKVEGIWGELPQEESLESCPRFPLNINLPFGSGPPFLYPSIHLFYVQNGSL